MTRALNPALCLLKSDVVWMGQEQVDLKKVLLMVLIKQIEKPWGERELGREKRELGVPLISRL